MFRRRDEEESTTESGTSELPFAQPIAQPAAQQKNITDFGGFQGKKDDAQKETTKTNSYGLVNAAATTKAEISEPQNQPSIQGKNMANPSFTEVTPKQTTYKLTASGAFTTQDQITTTPAASAKPATPAAGTNQTPRFDSIEAERRLTVGYGISLEGKVSDCDKLIIYGRVKAELDNVKTLHISESGKFTGSATIEHAEISGVFEGELRVSKNIVINSTGRVSGKITYGSIEIKPGGKFTGEIVEDKTLLDTPSTNASGNNSAWQAPESAIAASTEKEDKAA